MLLEEGITKQVIGGAIEVHRNLGPGLLESVYEECLGHELTERGLEIVRQFEVPILYRGHKLDCGFRADLLVENAVIVELKAVEQVVAVHEAQLMTYLRLSGKSVGLMINFNIPRLVDGIVRRVL
ncbi:MAG: GxxExxY protein [Planctomycetota bacterium]|jgi:GxxExxY protein